MIIKRQWKQNPLPLIKVIELSRELEKDPSWRRTPGGEFERMIKMCANAFQAGYAQCVYHDVKDGVKINEQEG